MKLLSKLFWRKRNTQAAAPAPSPVVSTPSPAPTPAPAPIAKPAPTPSTMTTTALPSVPKPSTFTTAPKTAPTATFNPAKESKLLTREQFDELPHLERSKFFENGGHLVAEVRHGDLKDIAAQSITRMQGDPDAVAEALIRGFGLSMADAAPLMIAWGASHLDSLHKPFDEARCKEALAKAEKSTKPIGYLKGKAAKTGFKAPGEVPEPERVAAEDALVKMLKDFESNTNPVLKRIWWERHHEEVEETAKNETKRAHNWVGYFVTQLPFPANAHVTPSK